MLHLRLAVVVVALAAPLPGWSPAAAADDRSSDRGSACETARDGEAGDERDGARSAESGGTGKGGDCEERRAGDPSPRAEDAGPEGSAGRAGGDGDGRDRADDDRGKDGRGDNDRGGGDREGGREAAARVEPDRGDESNRMPATADRAPDPQTERAGSGGGRDAPPAERTDRDPTEREREERDQIERDRAKQERAEQERAEGERVEREEVQHASRPPAGTGGAGPGLTGPIRAFQAASPLDPDLDANGDGAVTCDDFAWQEDAQAVYDRDPSDPYGLDDPPGPDSNTRGYGLEDPLGLDNDTRDESGVACEELPSRRDRTDRNDAEPADEEPLDRPLVPDVGVGTAAVMGGRGGSFVPGALLVLAGLAGLATVRARRAA